MRTPTWSTLATRGFDTEAFTEVADVIAQALAGDGAERTLTDLRRRVAALATRYPLYPHIEKAQS